MKLFLLLVNLIFINKAFQNVVEIKIEIGAKRRVTKIDVDFLGGDTTWRESIKSRINASKFKGAKRGKYTVRIAYIVDKEGNISDVECLKDPGYGMGAASVRAIKACSKWGSGPVRRARSTPIIDSIKVPG